MCKIFKYDTQLRYVDVIQVKWDISSHLSGEKCPSLSEFTPIVEAYTHRRYYSKDKGKKTCFYSLQTDTL